MTRGSIIRQTIYGVAEVLGSFIPSVLRLEELGQLLRRVATAQGFREVMVQVKVLQIPGVNHLEETVNRFCRGFTYIDLMFI